MTKFLKQPQPQQTSTPRKGTKKPPQPAVTAAPTVTVQFDGDISGIEVALDRLASVVSTYVTQARDGDNGSGLYSEPSGYPVKVRLLTEDGIDLFDGIVGTLEEQGDKQAAALGRIATAFERIAAAMEATPR
jgi:hypothetical protein